jgi:hypothetical protein
MKTFSQFTSDPIKKLRDEMIEKKTLIKSSLKKDSYNIIDNIMKNICKTHDISEQDLHDRWVKKYKMTPDEWIEKQILQQNP